MEEISSSDALEREILEDARKKGEKILKEGDAESLRIRAEFAERTTKGLDALARDYQAREERYRNENLARLPLEKGRMKASFVDRLLRGAVDKYLQSLPAERVAALALDLLRRAKDLLGSAEVLVRYKGISEAAAGDILSKALPRCSASALALDDGLAAAGVVVSNKDGMVTAKATMDLVGERLLDEGRGELALSLCGEALAL